MRWVPTREVGEHPGVGGGPGLYEDAHHICVTLSNGKAERGLIFQQPVEVSAGGNESSYHRRIASLDRQAEGRFVAELLGVDNVGGGPGVKENLDDLGIVQANGVGEVRSHPESRADFNVGGGAGRGQDSHHLFVSRLNRQAEGRLAMEVFSADYVQVLRTQPRQYLCQIDISGINGNMQGVGSEPLEQVGVDVGRSTDLIAGSGEADSDPLAVTG